MEEQREGRQRDGGAEGAGELLPEEELLTVAAGWRSRVRFSQRVQRERSRPPDFDEPTHPLLFFRS